MKGIILLGVGPKVGKTYISCLLINALKQYGAHPGYFKFVQMGAKDGMAQDARTIALQCRINQDLKDMCPYVFTKDTVPHLAVREQRKLIDFSKICERFAWNLATSTHMVVEGAGEIICPLVFENANILFQEDLIRRLKLNTILVAKVSASALSQCVLATHYLKSTNINVVGIILNGYDEKNYTHQDTKEMIERCCQVPIIAWAKTKARDLVLDCDLEELFIVEEEDDGREEIEI